jgi:hypothetical protein
MKSLKIDGLGKSKALSPEKEELRKRRALSLEKLKARFRSVQLKALSPPTQ